MTHSVKGHRGRHAGYADRECPVAFVSFLIMQIICADAGELYRVARRCCLLYRRKGAHSRGSDLNRKLATAAGAMSLALVSMLGSGCRNPACYRAGSLPPEMRAPPVRNAAKINLSDISLAAPRHDVLYPEDVIDVSIATGLEQEKPAVYPLRIALNGTVNMPLVGRVRIGEMTPSQAEQAIATEAVQRGVYRNPQVSVILNSRKTNKITVVGAVEKPQVVELTAANSDLLSAITLAGGLTDEADTVVEIRHPPSTRISSSDVALTSHRTGTSSSRQSVRVDLTKIGQADAGRYRLVDGSTVMVMRKNARVVHVIGLVKTPNQFEMPEDTDLRVLEALALAGGRSLQIADKVNVIRNGKTIRVSVRAAKHNPRENIRLAPGDVVSVEETPTTFVVDTLRSFMRIGFSGAIPGL